MKIKMFLLSILVSLILFLFGTTKATEYDNSRPWYLSTYFYANPNASSIACSPELTHCLVLVYDENPIFGYKIRGFFITEPAKPESWQTFMLPNFEIPKNYSVTLGYQYYNPYLNFPFGVQYNKNDGNYYFFIDNQYYIFYPINHTFISKGSFTTIGCSKIYGQGTLNSGWVYYGGIGGYVYKFNMFTGETVNFGIIGSDCGTTCEVLYWIRSYVGEKPNGNFQIYGKYYYKYGSFNYVKTCTINMTNFPSFSGINYELNNEIYYVINETNDSGIYKIYSPDFLTYSHNQLYYPFNTSNEEYIPLSIGAKSNVGTIYLHKRECNSTYGGYSCPQIDVNNISFSPLIIRTSIINPITLINRPVSAFVQAVCNDINYTISGTSNNNSGLLTLNLPCTSNITLTFINTNLKPDVYKETISFPSNCNQFFIKATYSEPFTLQVKVTDGLISQPIKDALVILDENSNLTNIDGKALISNVFPYDNPTFISQSFYGYPQCSQALEISGAYHTFFYSVSKDQYSSDTRSPLYLINTTTKKAIGYISSVLYPNAINVKISTYTSDGFEVSPVTILSNWSGNFYRSDILQENTYNPNKTSAGGMPVNILLYSNFSTFNLTIYVMFNNATYMKEIEVTNGTNENCINGYCSIEFILPYTFTNFPCFVNNDCIGGTCLGNIFYDLNGCKAGICNYKQQFCTSCDTRVGCYDVGTTEPCIGDLDCNKTCISSSTAKYGYCSSNGNCVYKTIPCDTNVACINTTIPIIAPNGSTIGNYNAGICANHQVCFSQSTTQQLFQIVKYWVSTGFNPFSITPNTTLYLDQRITCTPTEASSTKRYCITGVNVPKIEPGSIPESNQIVTQVGGTANIWQYKENPYDSNYWKFFDISYQCDLNCQTNIEFCPYGCNPETGYCFQQPVGEGIVSECNQSIFLPICSIANIKIDTTKNITFSQNLQTQGLGFLLMFITPIFWIMFIVIVTMIMSAWITKHMEIGIASGAIMLILMASVFPELIWIAIVIIVIAGFLIARTVVNAVRG